VTRSVSDQDPKTLAATLLPPEGQVTAASAAEPELEEQDLATRDWSPRTEFKVREIASFLAECFVRRLKLSDCSVYLYDRERANLVEAAASGLQPAQSHRSVIPLDPGLGLADLEVTQGRPGGCFSLPLWDGKVLLGVVYGRLAADRILDVAVTELGRAMAQGGALALSLALGDAERTAETGSARDPGRQDPVMPPYTLNPYLSLYLESALLRTSADEPVVLALVRLRGEGGRGRVPVRGALLKAGPTRRRERLRTGRAFGFGADSNQVGLVWLRTSRAEATAVLETVIRGEVALVDLIDGRLGTAAKGFGAGPAALSVYPEDGISPGALLATATDLLDLQSYVVSMRSGGGGDSSPQAFGDGAALVMDSYVLAREIDRQRQVLKQAIASGLDFQDDRIRNISQYLDRLIVVMQRFMGHRGAVL